MKNYLEPEDVILCPGGLSGEAARKPAGTGAKKYPAGFPDGYSETESR